MPLNVDKISTGLLSVNGVELGTIPIIVTDIGQASLVDPIYTVLPVGSVLAVQDYAGVSAGCTLFKTTIQNENYQDWIVIATTNVAATGNIGFNPIATPF
jgi:hypothetical protein